MKALSGSSRFYAPLVLLFYGRFVGPSFGLFEASRRVGTIRSAAFDRLSASRPGDLPIRRLSGWQSCGSMARPMTVV